MLMGAHDGGVDHGIFVVRVVCQMLEHSLPDAASDPAAESRMHHAKVAKSIPQVAPRNPSTIALQHRLHKQTVVPRRSAYTTHPTRQSLLDPLPLILPQPITPHHHPLKLQATQDQAYSQLDDTPYTFLSQIFDYGNTTLEKRAIFFKRLIPLLEFGREREGIDLSKVS